ncbi:MAG: CotH kinase family protein [Chitinophagales bacterium]
MKLKRKIPYCFYFLILVFFFSSCKDKIDTSCHHSIDFEAHNIPVVSIAVASSDFFDDEKGIYVEGEGNASNWMGLKANYYSGKKVKAHFAYYSSDSFQIYQNIKINVSGGGSRSLPQKSFNIHSKKDTFFHHQFFNDLSINFFSSLRLRNSGQDWSSTLMRDALMHSIANGMNIDKQAYQPVVVYLNGNYWGIYNLREKFNKSYLRSHHDIGDEKIASMEQRTNVNYGDTVEYFNLLKYIETNDLGQDEHYEFVQSQIHIDNFIDYFSAQIYFANTDWPSNNIKYWKTDSPTSKWRWFLHDTDMGFGFAPFDVHPGGLDHNTLKYALNDSISNLHNKPWSTFLFRNLLKNNQFRDLFLCTYKYNLETFFNPDRVIPIIDEIVYGIEAEMPNHINKWKDVEDERTIQSISQWRSNVEELYDFAQNRPLIVKKHLLEHFELNEDEWEEQICF